MGCRQSSIKNEYSKEEDNFKDLKEVFKLPEVDKRLPLNVRQAYKLKQSWKGIKRRMKETGIEMFIR